MSERTVSVKLSARVEQYIAAMKAAEGATTGLSRSSMRAISQLGGSLQSMGSTMTRYVTVPIAALGAGSVLMASRFGTSFAQMVGLANVPASEVDHLKEAVLSLAGETARSPQELADALYFAASSGLEASDALDAVEIAAHAAAAGMGDTETIVGLLTGAVGSYGAANLTAAEAADILTSTVREGRAAPEELAGALGRVLPIAASMGISMNEVGGAIAFMTNKGLDADEAVTGLRGVLTHLAAPGKAARDMLEGMGTSAAELKAAIDRDGLMGALDLLRDHGFNGNAQAMHALMPEVRGLNTLTALLADNSGSLDQIMGRLNDTTGSLGTAFGAVADTDAFKMKQAIADIKVALIRMGEILLPIAAKAASAISDLVNWFSDLPGPVQAVALAFGALLAVGGPVLMFVGSLLKNWKLVTSVLDKGQGSVSGMAKTFGVLGAGIAAGLYIYDQFQVSQRNVHARTEEVSAALGDATVEAWNYADAAAGARGAVDPLTVAQMALSNALTGGTEGGMALTQAMGALGLQTEDAWTITSGLYDALNRGTPEDYAAFWMDLGSQIGLTGDKLTLFAGVMGNTMPLTHDQMESAAEAAGFADGEFDALTGHARDLAEAIKMVGDVPSLATTFLNDAAAGSELGGNLVKLAQAQADAAGAGEDSTVVYENFLALLPNLSEEQQNVVLGLTDTNDAVSTGIPLWDSLWTSVGKATDGLSKMGLQLGGTRSVFDGLADGVSNVTEAQIALAAISERAGHMGARWVGLAEATSGASAAGDDALIVYQTLLSMLGNLSPKIEAEVRAQLGLENAFQKGAAAGEQYLKTAKMLGTAIGGLEGVKAAAGIEKIGDAAAEAVPNLDDLIDDMFSLETAMGDSAQRADQFRDSVTRLRGPQDDLRSATRDVWTEIEAMGDALEENGTTLGVATEAGRANQVQMEATTTAIFDHAAALLENGASAEEAAADIAWNVKQLNAQWVAAGYTEDQIRLLNAQYGLTPEQVTTYLELLGDKTARGQIGAYISNLKQIPASRTTTITATTKGTYAAEQAFAKVARPRTVALTPYLTKTSFAVQIHASGTSYVKSAVGRYVPSGSNLITSVSEPGAGDEVILPLDNARRMSQLLGMSEVGPRVAAAMGGGDAQQGKLTPFGAMSGGSSNTYMVTVNMPPGANGDDVVRALRKWQRQSGPLPLAIR